MIKKDIVLETLQGLVRNGQIKPEDVVESAKNEDSPIHNNFEWNNTKAAQEYRLWQARHLIVYKFKIDGQTEQQFYNIKFIVNDVPVQGYFTREKILSDKEMYLQLLKDAIDEIKYWEKKYKQIKELNGIVNDTKIKKLSDKLYKQK